jgi:hypothetical protein
MSRGMQQAWRWGTGAAVRPCSTTSVVQKSSWQEESIDEGEELLITSSNESGQQADDAQQQCPAEGGRGGAGEGWVDLVGDKCQGDWQVRHL